MEKRPFQSVMMAAEDHEGGVTSNHLKHHESPEKATRKPREANKIADEMKREQQQQTRKTNNNNSKTTLESPPPEFGAAVIIVEKLLEIRFQFFAQHRVHLRNKKIQNTRYKIYNLFKYQEARNA